jgi:hypothetical protein
MKLLEPVKNTRCLGAGGVCGRWFLLLTCLSLTGFGISSHAQNFLNVTNYGAIGDAVQLYVNTTSNSVLVTTTNQVPLSAIGDSIEVFGAGTPIVTPPSTLPSSSNNQDLVATILGVVPETNILGVVTETTITISHICQQKLTNTFATYGYNNTPAFMSAIAAVTNSTDTNDTIYIPAGTYLCLTMHYNGTSLQSAILVRRGGINFIGAGTNSTTLLSEGAWTLVSGAASRGFLVEIYPVIPIIYNYPVSFSDLTMDGGVQQGNTSIHGFPASTKDGTGWDETHCAFILAGGAPTNLNYTYFTNVLVQHWRGEEFKSIDGSTNGHIGIYNCTFSDGNATALNVYPAWDVRSNLFVNLFQIAEYYQAYSLFPSYFEYNTCTNITGNGFAVNGGKGNNPPFNIVSNLFYFGGASGSGNGIETVPADNLYVMDNVFSNVGNYVISFDLGAAGFQGTFYSSNIVISGNTIVNPYIFLELGGGSGPNDLQSVMNVNISSNVLLNPETGSIHLIQSYYGWTTNIHLFKNDCSEFINDAVYITSATVGNPYPLVDTDNIYWTGILTDGEFGFTNKTSYINGSRYKLIYPYSINMIIYLDDTSPNSIPFGAEMLFTNSTSNGQSVPIIPSSNLQTPPIMVPYGQTVTFYWQNWDNSWSTNDQPPPPTNLYPNY